MDNVEENVKDNNSHFEWVRLDHDDQGNLEEVTGTDVIFMLFGGLLPKIEKEVQHNVHIGNLKILRNIAYFDLNILTTTLFAENITYVLSVLIVLLLTNSF